MYGGRFKTWVIGGPCMLTIRGAPLDIHGGHGNLGRTKFVYFIPQPGRAGWFCSSFTAFGDWWETMHGHYMGRTIRYLPDDFFSFLAFGGDFFSFSFFSRHRRSLFFVNILCHFDFSGWFLFNSSAGHFFIFYSSGWWSYSLVEHFHAPHPLDIKWCAPKRAARCLCVRVLWMQLGGGQHFHFLCFSLFCDENCEDL